MKGIPIFDSCTHPTVDGQWLPGVRVADNSIVGLLSEMADNNVRWALAIGMAKVGGYQAAHYADFVRSHSSHLLPIAYCEFDKLRGAKGAKRYFKTLVEQGFVGIKIHPRFSQMRISSSLVECAIKASNDNGMFVCLCTHMMDPVNGPENSLVNLMALLRKVSDEKIILLHGATVRVLELMEMAKVFKNKLVDLSYTLLKYEGSSLDFDLQWLFKNCDRRICVGSDHPEWALCQLRRRFDSLVSGLDEAQGENIAFRNLINITGQEKLLNRKG